MQPPVYGPAPPRRRIWPWLLAGCGLLLVLGIVGLIVGGIALTRSVQRGAFDCVPSDFPKYQNQQVKSFSNFQGTDHNTCQISLDIDADSTTVTSFYQSQLNSGDWTVTASDTRNGTVSFSRRSSPKVHGTLAIYGHGTRTQVQYEIITDH